MGKHVVRFRVCDVCESEDQVVINSLSLNGHRYELDLCEVHTAALDDDLAGWLDKARKTGEPTVFDEPRAARRVTLGAGGFAPTPAAAVLPETRACRGAELPETAQRWHLTSHAEERMVERGFDRLTVLWTAERPDVVTPSADTQHRNRVEHVRGDCLVVIEPDTNTIVTVTYSSKHPLSDKYKKAGSA